VVPKDQNPEPYPHTNLLPHRDLLADTKHFDPNEIIARETPRKSDFPLTYAASNVYQRLPTSHSVWQTCILVASQRGWNEMMGDYRRRVFFDTRAMGLGWGRLGRFYVISRLFGFARKRNVSTNGPSKSQAASCSNRFEVVGGISLIDTIRFNNTLGRYCLPCFKDHTLHYRIPKAKQKHTNTRKNGLSKQEILRRRKLQDERFGQPGRAVDQEHERRQVVW